MRKAVVIGTGAGGATAARELQGKFDVTILEAGGPFHPFSINLATIEKMKKSGLLFNEGIIHWVFPPMRIDKAADKMVLVKGIGTGGTTTLSAGNAIRQDQDLKALGIDLDEEFEEIYREIPVSAAHQKKWHDPTQQAFAICNEMGLKPVATPKMADPIKCVGCGRCVLGCPLGAKWDSRIFLNEALKKGARLITGCRVKKVSLSMRRVQSVETSRGSFPADLVVVAAGGFGTPVVLQNSGLECQPNLFVDPVLCVAARVPGGRQNKEIPMPFVVQRKNYIISPYFDFLSFFFNRQWKYPSEDIFSLMIKLADSTSGSITKNRIQKGLTEKDRKNLQEAVSLCTQIFQKMGVKSTDLFLGTLNAGHPGGMLPLTEKEAWTFHSDRLPENLYVADASLFPDSLGNPPILTIIAMAKRVSRMSLRWA